MKIIIPAFERLEWMPPTIELLRKLNSNGIRVVYISIYPCEFGKTLNLEYVEFISLVKQNLELLDKYRYVKYVSGILFRLDNLVKKIISIKLNKVIDKIISEEDILWVVNEMTVLLAGHSFIKDRKYIFTCYELHEKNYANRHIEWAAKNANKTVVPEYCRAHIMKSRYAMKSTPIVLPNRSELNLDGFLPSDEAKRNIEKLDKIHADGKKILLYMGGINKERPLAPLLLGVSTLPNCIVAIMGRKSEYLNELEKQFPNKFVYIGSYLPPEHLLVASHCDIGILNYESINQQQGLNAIFCAPNKIYEYTGVGMPVLGNDIPGLRFDILTNKIGKIVDYYNPQSIYAAVSDIIANYDEYSKNAMNFYQSTDIWPIIKEQILE